MEYRVLRPDGKLMLRGTAAPLQLGIEVAGNGHTFALKSVKTARDLESFEFDSTDLESQEVRVYRADDGKRLLSVIVPQPVSSRTSYALSSDGAQLAVVSGAEIKLFTVPVDNPLNEGSVVAIKRGITQP
jgi:hypothetical protein